MNKQLKKVYKDYLKIEPPSELADYGWDALRKQIEKKENKRIIPFLPTFSRSLIISFAVFIFVSSAGFVLASWRAKPGETFYPIKKFSTQIISKIGNIQNKKRLLKSIYSSPSAIIKQPKVTNEPSASAEPAKDQNKSDSLNNGNRDKKTDSKNKSDKNSLDKNTDQQINKKKEGTTENIQKELNKIKTTFSF